MENKTPAGSVNLLDDTLLESPSSVSGSKMSQSLPHSDLSKAEVIQCDFQGFVRRKTILKDGRKISLSSWQRYWLQITGNILVFYASKSFKGTNRSDFREEKCKVLCLNGWYGKLVDGDNSDAFQLINHRTGTLYKFKAASKTAAKMWVVELDWWSVSRDCVMYAIAVVTLILTLLDDVIYWHEALLLVLMYTLYILAMVFNGRLGTFFKSGCCSFKKPKAYTEISPLLANEKRHILDAARRMSHSVQHNDVETGIHIKRHDSTDSDSSISSLWSWPGEKVTAWKKLLWVFTWPISLVLWATIPDCRRRPSFYPLTFIMCITWIGGVSYLVAWMITVLGDTLNVPDSITGLTILAAGTSLPEAVSSVLVTVQGHGTMGISNSIGSNTFDILLCLGLPWLIKSLAYPSVPGNHWVTINSSGLSYSAISLLSTLFALYGCLLLNKFQLDWKIGITCALIYVGYLVLAALIEMNVFFVVNLPICPH